MKNSLKKIFKLIAPHFFGIFFEKSLFKGRWFDESNQGYHWLIRAIFIQKILGFNRDIPFPIAHTAKISNWKNINFHPDNLDNFQSNGCYFQNYGAKISIGHGTYIAPNVGIITSNHDTTDPDKILEGKEVKIGKKCWIGMNAIILPGVELGPHTVVAAGAVVTKSFSEGYCVIAGVPARITRSVQ